MNSRTCAADGCEKVVEDRYLMCWEHWFMVPKDLRGEIWRHYRASERYGGQATRDYLSAVADARRALRGRSGEAGA